MSTDLQDEACCTFPRSLKEEDWDILLQRIRIGRCIPFLGAGACHGVLPLGGEIAAGWARKHRYPLKDKDDLAKVAQFLAVRKDDAFPKYEILEEFPEDKRPDFLDDDEPHAALADLRRLPLYVTTNYDDFMVQALKHRQRDPKQEYCRWNAFLRDLPASPGFGPEYKPTGANPLVYHLHGHTGVPESMVLTEDDYLDFLAMMSENQDMIPLQVREALGMSSLLFLGYRLADWDFRVLFRNLGHYMKFSKVHMSVQIAPVEGAETVQDKLNILNYLDKYFEKVRVRVYWGTCREFAAELRDRLAGAGGEGGGR